MSDGNQNKQAFAEKVADLVNRDVSFKMTFSKKRHQNKTINNVYIKPVLIKHQIHYSLTNRFSHRDEVKNYTKEQMSGVIDNLLGNMFYNAVLITAAEETTLLQNKKGRSTMFSKKPEHEVIIETDHDHQKKRLIQPTSTWLTALGLAGQDGKIYDKSQDKFRQINRYTEVIDHLIKEYPEDQIFTIADMGSGKGYLTFALYDHLVNTKKMRVKMTGYELREEIVSLCYSVAIKEGFIGLTFQQKDISDVDAGGCDMVIALHACDIATDMAIAKGIEAGAQYIVVSPCCHKQIRKAMHHDNPLSPILAHGILEERQAEILTDGMRALILEANGYRTQVFEFISSEHTSKNLMITAVKSTPDPAALSKLDAIKKLFGIEYHYLERLLTQ